MSLVFVSGAVRSGKSTWAEAYALSLAKGGPLAYIATARADDPEMRERAARHQAARKGKGFETIERSADVGETASLLPPNCTVLLECLGTLLANEMFGADAEKSFELGSPDFYVRKILSGLSLLNSRAANLLIVSNDIFSDGVTYGESVETYMKTLGALHVKLAALAETSVECAAGLARIAHRRAEGEGGLNAE